MICPQCQHENPDGAQFCNSCGQPSLGGPAAAPPVEEEKVVWEGARSAKSLLNFWWCLSFLLVIPILVFLGVAWYEKARRGYRLTNERLTITTGLFGRQSEDLKLVRVEDVNFTQTFFNRLMKVGDVHLISTDKTDPNLTLQGVPDPEPLKETIWKLVREQRKRMVYMEQLNV
ncbi:MAG: PH domain-containing protein [Candidatus Eremiobacterota bacterium]